ncbi:MAG: ATP-binding protein [Verrucomicrobiota bacterium]|jgi:signal transduction histidine kinase
MPKGWLNVLGALVVALAETSWGQKAPNWRVYRVADGLPSPPACATVTISPHGNVLVTHPGIACVTELDGYTVKVIPAPGPPRYRVYESPAGQLWTVVPEGLLEFKRSGVWSLHAVPEIAAVFQAGLARPLDPVPLYPLRQGLVLLLLPDRLLEFDCGDPYHPRSTVLRVAQESRLGSFTGLSPAHDRDGGLWVAGARGLAKLPGPPRNLKPESEWREYLFPAALPIQNLQEPHEDKSGNVTAVAESVQTHQKLAVHFDGQQWTTEAGTAERIRFAWRGPEGTCWAANLNTLFQCQAGGTDMIEYEGISARAYNDLAVEPGGAFWLATSDGLFRYAPLAWRSPRCAQTNNSPVHCLTMDHEDRLWFIAGNLLHSLRADQHEEYPCPASTGRRLQGARALVPLKNGALLLEAGGQLLTFQPATGFTPMPRQEGGAQFRVLGTLKDGSVCVQSYLPGVTNQPIRLETYDGTKLEPFADSPAEAAFGGELTALFAAQNGDLWLSGDQGTVCYHDQKWRAFFSTDQTTPRAALGFAEVGDGKTWCATEDRIWEFDGRNWPVVRQGFERINGLVRTRDGGVWVAANSGLYRYLPAQNAWIENGSDEGLPSADVRQVYEDRSGRLWAGTARGLSFYDRDADKDPPLTRIRELTETGRKVQEGGSIALSFDTSQDKWNYTPRGRLLFSYRLDDHEWTRFSDEANGVSFPDQPAGMHYLSVRAMDRNGNFEANPARYEFEVVLPWYKESRLVLIALAGLVGALFFAGLAFNRHQRLLRSYAQVEKKVAERTRELEMAHRELLHSQKMTALGTLAAGIAHDFNNILSIIQGSAQIIEDNLDNPQKVRTRLDRIKTVVQQGAGIVKAMLGFSRDSGQQAAQCAINAVVEETIKLLGDRFLREVQVTFQPAPSLPVLTASKDLIQQILLNFIFNATESTTGRKRIILTTRPVDKLPADLVLVPARAESYVAIAVRDFGCGIPPANLPRIFEPFFTTKAFSARRGTGLGLSMVYQLARKMEAGLAVESAVDQGSTFTLILGVRDSTGDK